MENSVIFQFNAISKEYLEYKFLGNRSQLCQTYYHTNKRSTDGPLAKKTKKTIGGNCLKHLFLLAIDSVS